MNDTIAAVATAYGEGGIGIIRISGEKSLAILGEVFEPAGKYEEAVSRRMMYGKIVDWKSEDGKGNKTDGAWAIGSRETRDKEIIDEVLAVYMKGPKTYTAEDVVEINCHGGIVPLRKTLALVLRKGARLAEPGEFTKRAFLNGRLDLSQAEAVIDLVKAKTDKGFDVALSQLEGSLSAQIEKIRKKLLDLLVDITVNIDYPDEDIEELAYETLEKNISSARDMIEKLLRTASTGRMIREGIRIAIVGKPNVGKSSLMNGLLRANRAIVTEIPGTTRDTIEEAVNIRNIPVYLIDTAGIRETTDQVEQIGIEKSKEAVQRADFVIFILDASRALSIEDREIATHLEEEKTLVLINKQDLNHVFSLAEAQKLIPGGAFIHTSLSNGEGLTEIEDFIEKMVYGGQVTQKDSMMVNNVRHIELLMQGKDSLVDSLEMARRREALDFIEIDVRNAYERLGEIIGETVSDDIIDEVFSRFCLGK